VYNSPRRTTINNAMSDYEIDHLRSVLAHANPAPVPLPYKIALSVRIIVWTVLMAYAGFLMTGSKNLTPPGMTITTAFLGALVGFLMAIMFTLRNHRRQSRAARH
jgi:membrane associated rhomboid family serine protease